MPHSDASIRMVCTGTMTPLTAGVDEAGRGPLAGPVIAAAVVLSADAPVDGLRDSKQLSAADRERLAGEIRRRAVVWALGRAEVEEIDRLNILQASMVAMQRAVAALDPAPGKVLVDGNRCPVLPCPVDAIVKGDQKVDAIAAASIVAKVERDREMAALDVRYPGYGFAQHKGYPTRLHIEALREFGASPVHRRSFAPVRTVLQARGQDVAPAGARRGAAPPLK